MKRFVPILAVLLLMLQSCKDEAPIPDEDMAGILHDLFLLDAYVDDVPDMMLRCDSVYVYRPVYEKYGYSDSVFASAIKFYLADIERYKEIVASAMESINSELTVFEEERKREELGLDEESVPAEPQEIEEAAPADVFIHDIPSQPSDTIEKKLPMKKLIERRKEREHRLDKKEMNRLKEKYE